MAEFENLVLDIHIFRLITGMLVFLVNIIIFSIFAMKKKKSPSDCLVLPNLMIEGLHGLGLCGPFYLLDPDWVMKDQFCFQILVFFSLVMLILMTFNRYVAAVRPLKYKSWFKKRFIFLGFLGITLVTVVLFIATCCVLFIAKVVENSVERYCETYYTEKSYWITTNTFETENNHRYYRSGYYRGSGNLWTNYWERRRSYTLSELAKKLRTAMEINIICHYKKTYDKTILYVDYFVLYL